MLSDFLKISGECERKQRIKILFWFIYKQNFCQIIHIEYGYLINFFHKIQTHYIFNVLTTKNRVSLIFNQLD
ncbi:MAG: hypothetical protein DRR19_25735 [Candidatus Parabeggiatoa sp. nov. 1]|nr:MAG: hypothetical protein DRR19_25735 [Gammaproteobacteria bacterium]